MRTTLCCLNLLNVLQILIRKCGLMLNVGYISHLIFQTPLLVPMLAPKFALTLHTGRTGRRYFTMRIFFRCPWLCTCNARKSNIPSGLLKTMRDFDLVSGIHKECHCYA